MEAAEYPLSLSLRLSVLTNSSICFIWKERQAGTVYVKPSWGLHSALRGRHFLGLASASPSPIHIHFSFIPCINLTADSFHPHNNRFLRNLQCSSPAGRVPVFQTGFRGCPWSRSVYLTQLSPKNCSSPTNFTRPRSTCFSCPVPHQNESAMHRSVLVCQKLPTQGSSEE